MTEIEPARLYFLYRLADQIKIVQPSQFDASILPRIAKTL
jgi:hypothetical protein